MPPRQRRLPTVPETGTARARASTDNGGVSAPVTARGEATRRRILDAAEEVFGELGYYEASVSEITRRAEVAQGTFYIYFHTKRDIFVELVNDLSNRLRAAMRHAIAGASTRLQIEAQGFRGFFQFASEHRRIYRIVQEAERVAPEAAEAYYYAISSGYERALRQAMEAGDIRPMNPEAVAFALMGIGHFLALRWLIWPAAPQQASGTDGIPTDVFESAMDFIAHGLSPYVSK